MTPDKEPALKIPLFEAYPGLASSLPYTELATLPTPVDNAHDLASALGLDGLHIKRDDLSGTLYGGNKVRKLEFHLAAAIRKGARDVITMGFAGSNHALATAVYARQLGLRSTSMLLPQVNAHYVRRNLLASHYYGARLSYHSSIPGLIVGFTKARLLALLRTGSLPSFIPAGGSCPLGTTGYVNAALELGNQVKHGVLPEPDLIYVALGSGGTCTGLSLGLEAAGLKTKVLAVRVIGTDLLPETKLRRLLSRTGAFLNSQDRKFPDASAAAQERLIVRNDCLGECYAQFTEKGLKATRLLREKAGITPNGAYSAKAFSAVMDDAAAGALKGKTVLFWNTYNSVDLASITSSVDYRKLPKNLHRYFEEPVQPLDEGLDR